MPLRRCLPTTTARGARRVARWRGLRRHSDRTVVERVAPQAVMDPLAEAREAAAWERTVFDANSHVAAAEEPGSFIEPFCHCADDVSRRRTSIDDDFEATSSSSQDRSGPCLHGRRCVRFDYGVRCVHLEVPLEKP
jgi:hypothetical protein